MSKAEVVSSSSSFKICRTCLQQVCDTSRFFSLDYTEPTNQEISTRQKLLDFVPELNLSITLNPIICYDCAVAVDSAHRFWEKCLQADERIYNCKQKVAASPYVDLVQVVRDSIRPNKFACDVTTECERSVAGESIIEQPDALPSASVKQEMNRSYSDEDSKYVAQVDTADIKTCTENELPNNNSPKCLKTEVLVCNESKHVKLMPRPNKLDCNKNLCKKIHKCSVCVYSTNLKSNLTRHMRTHKYKIYKCTKCEYRTNRINNITTHIRNHNEEKPFRCAVCDYSTISKVYLSKHILIHTGEKPHKCSMCPHRSRTREMLTLHMRTHTGEKPYSCNVCGYRATSYSLISCHQKIHTGYKPVKCDTCKYRCYNNKQLKDHKRVHTEERPYKCSLCNVTYKYRNSLNTHMRMHTGDMYNCTECTYATVTKSHLQRHVKAKHAKPE